MDVCAWPSELVLLFFGVMQILLYPMISTWCWEDSRGKITLERGELGRIFPHESCGL